MRLPYPLFRKSQKENAMVQVGDFVLVEEGSAKDLYATVTRIYRDGVEVDAGSHGRQFTAGWHKLCGNGCGRRYCAWEPGHDGDMHNQRQELVADSEVPPWIVPPPPHTTTAKSKMPSETAYADLELRARAQAIPKIPNLFGAPIIRYETNGGLTKELAEDLASVGLGALLRPIVYGRCVVCRKEKKPKCDCFIERSSPPGQPTGLFYAHPVLAREHATACLWSYPFREERKPNGDSKQHDYAMEYLRRRVHSILAEARGEVPWWTRGSLPDFGWDD